MSKAKIIDVITVWISGNSGTFFSLQFNFYLITSYVFHFLPNLFIPVTGYHKLAAATKGKI